MTEVKISIIGAGSATFSMNFIGDLCQKKSLQGSTVCFMDIDKQRLDVVYSLAKRYAAETKIQFKFQKTLEREEALQDADFVVNVALVGGRTDEGEEHRVEEKYGYPFRGVRFGSFLNQLGFMLSVARDMEDVCPDAWLLQGSNPLFEGCTLMTRETKTKIVGLCEGHYGVSRVAKTIGIDPEKITFQAPGVNHCIWMTDFRYEGKDAYPILDEWMENKAEEYWRTWDGSPSEVYMSRASVSLYKMFGLFPIGDTPRFGGAWWHLVDMDAGKKWFNKYGGHDTLLAYEQRIKRLNDRMDRIFKIANDPSASVSKEFPPIGGTMTVGGIFHDQPIHVIDAITNDIEGKFQVNVPNNGAIQGIGDDVVVEVPGIISGRGVQAIHVGSLPKLLTLNILRTHVIPMETYLDAFLTGDRNALLYRILSDHRTKSYEQAQRVMDAILALPFNEDLKKHFK